MTSPTITVEVAFDSDPLDASPVWTDISGYVEAAVPTRIRRGRTGEFEGVQPSTLTLTLNNTDGRFTPGLASSPYFPHVTINKRIRVRATYDGTTYDLFDGHIDRWPVSWQGGVLATGTVTATDRTKLLARRPMRSLLEEEILADAPAAYYPLQESSGQETVGDASGNGRPSGVLRQTKYGGGEYRLGADGPNHYTALALNTADADPALQAWEGWYVDFTDANAWVPDASAGAFSIEVMFRASETGTVDLAPTGSTLDLLTWVRLDGSRAVLWVWDDQLWFSARSAGNSTGFVSVTSPGGSLLDGEWHHAVVTCSSGRSVRVYVDGEESGATVMTAEQLPARTGTETVIAGAGVDFSLSGYVAGGYLWPGRMMMSSLVFYDSQLSAARVDSHYQLMEMETPETAELSSERVERLAALAGVPTATIELGLSRVSNRQDTSGRGVNQALAEVAASEAGLVFFDGAGQLMFHSRSHRMNQAVGLTLDAAADEVDADLEFEESDATMLNDVSVDRPRGGPVRTVDDASTDVFGVYSENISSILVSDAETKSFGQWLVSRRAMPAPRAGRVSVDPFTAPELYPAALGTELGTRVELTNLPATAPDTSVSLVIEGVEHVFSVSSWLTTWDTSPADELEYVVWDTSTWDSARWAW